MKLYPAIDIKSGQCVRLRHGRMDDVTIFNKDPAAQALAFRQTGFTYLHIVDLDGAIAGESRNGAAVSAIIEASNAEIQLGGGIRNRAQIDYWLDTGLSRVVLGTAALHDPELVQSASRAYPGRIAVGIDTRAGYVSVSGWVEDSKITGLELAKRLEAAGIAAIIHTDIDRDGVLTGLNLDASLAIAQAVNIPIIASGGLAGLEDIQNLLRPEYSALEGAICGRALYDGRLDGAAALQLAARAGLDA